jgi:acyl-CoA dehydrogenase
MSAAFAFAADIAMLVLGGSLKRKERLSARLADILGHLYLASTVLKRYEDQGAPVQDKPLMKKIIFPLGKSYTLPDDRLDHNVADILISPSVSRERLTEGIHIPADIKDQLGLYEDALKKVVEAEPVEKKIRKAVRLGILKRSAGDMDWKEAVMAGVISSDEAALLRAANLARKEVVRKVILGERQ